MQIAEEEKEHIGSGVRGDNRRALLDRKEVVLMNCDMWT